MIVAMRYYENISLKAFHALITKNNTYTFTNICDLFYDAFCDVLVIFFIKKPITKRIAKRVATKQVAQQVANVGKFKSSYPSNKMLQTKFILYFYSIILHIVTLEIQFMCKKQIAKRIAKCVTKQVAYLLRAVLFYLQCNDI